MKQQAEEGMKLYNAEKKKLFDFLEKFYTSDTFDYTETFYNGDSRTYTGGFIKCKKCGKEYRWTDWGRYLTRAFTLGIKHINKKHYEGKYYSLATLNEWLDEWLSKRHPKIFER